MRRERERDTETVTEKGRERERERERKGGREEGKGVNWLPACCFLNMHRRIFIPAGHVARRKVHTQRMCMCAWKLPARSDYKYTAPHLQDVVHMGVLRCSERLEIRRLRACCHRLADFGGHAGGPPGQRLGSHLAWGRPAADVQAISSSCNLRRPGTLEVAE